MFECNCQHQHADEQKCDELQLSPKRRTGNCPELEIGHNREHRQAIYTGRKKVQHDNVSEFFWEEEAGHIRARLLQRRCDRGRTCCSLDYADNQSKG
jgi:hypothetical protein